MRSHFTSISTRLALITILAATTPLAVANPTSAAITCDGWMMFMPNAGFEDGVDGTPVPLWCSGEGPDVKGVDRGLGWSRSGANDAYIEAMSTSQWNALKQNIVVPRDRTVELSAYVWTSGNVTAGYFGVRNRSTGAVHREIRFGPLLGYQRLSVLFPTGGSSDYTAFVGFWSPGGFSWLVVDDFQTSLVP